MRESGKLNINGNVENVIYKNASNGYIVLEIDSGGELISVVGNLGEIAAGEKLSLYGDYIESPKYGKQFKAEAVQRLPPESVSEIKRYLGSGIIRGLGPSMAKKIADTFGEESLEIIENFPQRLTEVNGITADRALYIGNEYKRICGVKTVIEFLSGYGLSPQTAVSVWQKYDNSGISMIRENPYLLCQSGIDVDFETADRMAEGFNVDSCDLNRVNAAITHVLKENANDGHTCLPQEALHSKVCENYQISTDAFDIALDKGIDSAEFGILTSGQKSRIYLSNYYQAERYIADKLSQMVKLNSAETHDFSEEIAGVEWTEGIAYETLQKAAINGCLGNNLFILTGGPGTGKTTTLNAVIQLLKKNRKSLGLAAPTGRAAKRMSELTGENARTIHRLLEVDITSDNLLRFKRNEFNPLKLDVIIIDEMSMVDVLLFEALLRAVKTDSKLIMVGDSNQLPSVGAGNVLRDLISSGLIPTVELKEIFRQAAESLIVTNAHRIISGNMPELGLRDRDFFFMEKNTENDIAELVIELNKTRLPNKYGFSPFDDIQVLTPTKIGVAGTKELNKSLQLALNPPSRNRKETRYYDVVFREGDKVMQIANDYDVAWKKGGEKGTGVFNGDIGLIAEIDPYSGNILINFEGRVACYTPSMMYKIEHAYAITIHKSQGSEYNAVIMPVTSRTQNLLFRNLLYTGVTRAKTILIIVGQRATIGDMINNERKTLRYSNIKPLLTAKCRNGKENES